ncbi:MAG: hypothetical protein QG670_2506 [Thermoproteota archaeon]|nr:hypothetical protein [Thermoproteota archaeon]
MTSFLNSKPENERPPIVQSKSKSIGKRLLACLIIGIVVGVSVSLSVGLVASEQRGPDSEYALGLSLGYSQGLTNGTKFGYNTGYMIGNSTGYNVGYFEGLASSNATGYQSGYNIGYSEGVVDGVGKGYNIRDPTYVEAMSFVSSDEVDKNNYVNESYNCENFATDFKNHAFAAGYRCGYVMIDCPSSGHAIICFNTTDKNVVFIEPQNDAVMTVEVGQPYWNRAIYETPNYDDTVVRILIAW